MASTAASLASPSTAETSASDTALRESHKHRHHSKNKKSDPFLELQDGPVKLPDQTTPSNENENESSRPDSMFMDVRWSCGAHILSLG